MDDKYPHPHEGPDRDDLSFPQSSRVSCARETLSQERADLAAEVLEHVEEHMAALDLLIRKARNTKARSSYRKEHWWLKQLAELLERWRDLHR